MELVLIFGAGSIPEIATNDHRHAPHTPLHRAKPTETSIAAHPEKLPVSPCGQEVASKTATCAKQSRFFFENNSLLTTNNTKSTNKCGELF
jgi:hypothetical protein